MFVTAESYCFFSKSLMNIRTIFRKAEIVDIQRLQLFAFLQKFANVPYSENH